jgi:murein DD-endopeptidase MepM/ murein hydrolase activator NlpD
MKVQIATGAIVFGLSAWLTVTSVSYFGSRHLLSDTTRYVDDLEQAYADLVDQSQLAAASFTEQLDALKSNDQRQRAALDELGAIRDTLDRQLASRERLLASVTEQRDHARALAGNLEHALAEVKEVMQVALADKTALSGQLESTQQRLSETRQQRDAERQVEVGLRWQIARLEAEVGQLRSRREMAQVWLKDWVLGSTEALEQLFVDTGVDLEQLLQRVGGPELGQGGPLQVAAAEPAGAQVASTPPGDAMGSDIQRLAALQRLARVLPLASPLDHFSLSSGFGKRRDPFTKGWAYPAGLDFYAASGSAALATAPGHVVHAGPSGPYGNLVEIDHGMGVVTRYAHLKKVTVAVGDDIDFRQEVGVIGSTGRSTGLHLHYEVRIDDINFDPSRFLDAGRLLVGIFSSPPGIADVAATGGG